MAFEDKEEQEAGDHHGPSHHPLAPPDELFDIATSVDPSYIISLIRKILPDVKNDHNFCGADGDSAPNGGLKIDLMEDSASSSPKDGVRGSPDHNSEAMDVVNGFEKSSYQDGDGENLCRKVEQPGVSAGEEVWEEYGCVLWDLAASRNHAELMEIILGIIGNLACHEVFMQRIVSTHGLIEIIVDQLFLDDTQCLIEACRYPALEVILRSIEALSVLDSYSQEITSNKKLLQLVCDLVKFPDKLEVANSCVTAVVVLANILSDIDDLASEISQDLPFIQGLLGMIPFASDDLEARSALWSVVARLLVKVQEDEMRQSSLRQYASVFVSFSDMIEDDLLDHQLDETSHCPPCGFKRSARVTAVSSLSC